MAKTKRYYWFRLKTDFYDDIRVLRVQAKPDGDHAVILYQRLMLKAIRDGGRITIPGGEIVTDLALLLREDPTRFAACMDLLGVADLVRVEKDGVFLPDAMENVGSEEESAARKRRQRQREKANHQDVAAPENGEEKSVRDNVTAEKEKEKETEIDTESETTAASLQGATASPVMTLPLKDEGTYRVEERDVRELDALYPELDAGTQLRHMKSWLLANGKRRKSRSEMPRFIAGWMNRAADAVRNTKAPGDAVPGYGRMPTERSGHDSSPKRPTFPGDREISYDLAEAQRRMDTMVPTLRKKG